MDILLAMPGFLLAIAIIVALGVGMVNVIIAVGVHAIPSFARVVRGATLAIKQQEFVLASRALGSRDGLVAAIDELVAAAAPAEATTCACGGACTTAPAEAVAVPEVVVARPPERIEMDRAGYFVIVADRTRKVIMVEHYAYDNRLQHVIEGTTSRDLSLAIIDAGWVSQLSHAAYLRRELARAELSLKHRLPYVQDGA